MKKAFSLLIALVLVIGMTTIPAFAETKVIGAYLDAADDYYRAGLEVFAQLARDEGWEVNDVVGQGTAPEQITAVENFITNKVDAIIIYQNSPQASSECLAKAYAANIPVFFCTHTPPDEPGLAGFAGYDFVKSGKIAAKNAIEHGVKRVIMIEGKLGQGTASGQTEGFVTGYKEAGLDVGDGDGAGVVVRLLALVLGAEVPGGPSGVGVSDQGAGVEVGKALFGHGSTPDMRKAPSGRWRAWRGRAGLAGWCALWVGRARYANDQPSGSSS
jgi:ABC-type sugar transport system substrate-binding protein